jgi:hypothetical protein
MIGELNAKGHHRYYIKRLRWGLIFEEFTRPIIKLFNRSGKVFFRHCSRVDWFFKILA